MCQVGPGCLLMGMFVVGSEGTAAGVILRYLVYSKLEDFKRWP